MRVITQISTIEGATKKGRGRGHEPLARRCHLILGTNPRPDVLMRVLTLLRRHGCRIVAVDFRQADRHGPGRLEVSVDAPARVVHRLASWLMGLVDVIGVRDAQADTVDGVTGAGAA